ncbi:discoidin domain-containing protein [Streptomyces sp. BE20]|uniref:discoidin domain-containing protein n=1 Tax=Streptomyces sp. BE20 TaxID=3002525 RepID=UPI002E76B039|nr:discoidin domain-containing protein [Streptomyces sp. BE20]MEE1827707.1 discoidin domain-containing protein [Streptomyces sp. BE20]
MTDTDLIVPVEVHALLATRDVAAYDDFRRWTPKYPWTFSKDHRSNAEPPIQHSEGNPGEGIHVQWQLPEALTTGAIDPATGVSTFPWVPNRWLVVRYAQVRGELKAAGFLIHSDYLEKADGGPEESAFTPFVDPASPKEAPRHDYIGRAHKLSDGPWREPPARPQLFLTAIGSGLPAFAAFAPYHENVFLFHDTLADLKANDNYPPPCTVSYCVIGWYSRDDADILTTARDIEGLLPPDADPDSPADVLRALGWAAPDDMPNTITRTRYVGTALGIPWNRDGGHHASDRPETQDVKVAIGHSTADAVAALADHQTGGTDLADQVRALFHGNPDALDGPDWQVSLDEITRRSWFSGHDGGATWQVVNRPSDQADTQAPPPDRPDWITALNRDQDDHDQAKHRLASAQWRLWTLWWLRRLPENRRPLDYTFDEQAWDQRIHEAGTRVTELEAEVERLSGKVPHGLTPEEVQAAIDRYPADNKLELADELELKRTPRQSYHRPADPVLALTGSGTSQPLGRDEDDPLPCRLPSALLTRVKINNGWVGVPANPQLPANTPEVPGIIEAVVAEFALLDQAVRTPAAGGADTALHAVVADPAANSQGPWPEYSQVWRQPWLPLYLQWEIKHCATPYQSQDAAPNWEFGLGEDGDPEPDRYRYRWTGRGAAPGDGDGGRRWNAFGGRAFVTPSTRFVLREQARRLAEHAPPQLARQLRAMREELEGIDVLSQTLDGFHDWLIQQDGAAQAVTDHSILALAGETNHVPDGAEGHGAQRFQPVRAGQFHFVELVVIDRFGRVCSLVQPVDTQPVQFPLIRADSVVPDHDLFPNPPGPQRFVQLPPRLVQPARVRLDAVPLRADQPPAEAAETVDTTQLPGAEAPVAGWLLVNHLDRTLLVYGPDGEPLGELRVVRDVRNTRTTAWNTLPHAPYRHPEDDDFAAAYPHVAAFARGLLGHEPEAFEALAKTIDTALDHILEPSPDEDRSPARLIGRPIALIRTRLNLDLMGEPLTDPSWKRALVPPDEDYPDPSDYPDHRNYPDYRWTVRLGDPDRLSDGLIGYFAADDHDQRTRYHRFHAVDPNGPSNGYVTAIDTGAHLTLPARPADRPATHHLTLLACPHTAVHATTDILPVADVTVDADTTHRALARIRASFRLNPLLAPDRFGPPVAAASLKARPGHPVSAMTDGDPTTSHESGEPPAAGDWVRLDLHTERRVEAVDILLGRPDGSGTPTATDLEASTDGEQWTVLRGYTRVTEIHHTPEPPLTARFLRLRHTSSAAEPCAVREFGVQAEPPDKSLVMPRPAAWHGDWTWAEPIPVDGTATGLPLPDWDDHLIDNADQLSHPDAPLPVARSGYLQLQPPAPGRTRTTPAPVPAQAPEGTAS